MTARWCLLALISSAAVLAQTTPAPGSTTGPATATISGVVRDAGTGLPVEDASLYATIGNARAIEANTDSQGRYTLRGLTPGSVRITARGRLEEGIPPPTTRIITVTPGQELTSIDFRLVGTAEISGKIVDQNREPVPGIMVSLIAREYSLGALRYVFATATQTDDQGQYLLKNVGTGRAFLLMVRKDYQSLPAISDAPANPRLRRPAIVPTFYPGTDSIEGAQTLTLAPGERRENVDLQVRRSPSYCLEGTLGTGAEAVRFDIAEGRPTSGSMGSSSMFVSAPGGLTGPDGKVRICDLHAGEYNITVHNDTSASRGVPTFYGTGQVTITDRDENRVVVAARARVDVPGEVVWDGPAPDPPVSTNLQIAFRPLTRAQFGGEALSARSTGKFSIDGMFMDEFATFGNNGVNPMPPGAYLKDMTYGDRSVLLEPLRPGSAVGEATLRVVLSRDGGTISAKITDKDDHPLPDANVVIFPASSASEAALPSALINGQTDQNGAWTSGQLAPGKYYVIGTAGVIDHSPETIGKLWRGRDKAKQVDLAAGAKAQVTLLPAE